MQFFGHSCIQLVMHGVTSEFLVKHQRSYQASSAQPNMFSVGPLKVGRLKLGMCADPIQVLLNWSKLWTSFWLGVFKNCNFWSGFGLTFLYALILKYIWCLKFLKTSKIQQPSVAANFLSCTNCAKFCFSIPRYLWYTITFVLCQTHTLYYFIKCPILIVLCILRCVDPYYIICTDFY